MYTLYFIPRPQTPITPPPVSQKPYELMFVHFHLSELRQNRAGGGAGGHAVHEAQDIGLTDTLYTVHYTLIATGLHFSL